MANYSGLNRSTACLASPWSVPATQEQQQKGCVRLPSSFNPYKYQALPDIKISTLEEIIRNPYFSKEQRLCIDAVELLPPFFFEIYETREHPKTWNPPVLDIHKLATKTFPYPLNESGPGLVAGWWWNSIVNDTAATTSFINAIENGCTREICLNLNAVGDTDIAGIGMLISTAMLIILALIFAFPATSGLKRLRRQHKTTRPDALPKVERESTVGTHEAVTARPSIKRRLRNAIADTLDDLLSAIIIFMLSVLVAAIVLRRENFALFDIFMAEALSLICGFALVMVASARWATSSYGIQSLKNKGGQGHVKKVQPASVDEPVKLWTLVGIGANAVLLTVLFSLEFSYQRLGWMMGGIPLERRCLEPILGDRDVDRLGAKKWVFPLCFCLWLAALAASLVHLPWVKKRQRPDRTRLAGVFWWLLGIMPIFFGVAGMLLLCVMYYATYQQMKRAYGDAFTESTKDWGFGQYLALATWVPPFLQLAHRLFGRSKPDALVEGNK